MEGKTFKTHMIYVDYPMNSLNLNEMEKSIATLELNLGDVVIVDCKGMDYICSSGLRVFLSLYKMIAQKGAKLIIRNLQPLVKNVFDMSGFSQIFNIE
jgi:anti-anti-sigma factor